MCAGLCLLAIVVVVEHQGSGGVTRAPVSGAWVLARGPPESVHRVSGTSAGGGEGGECGGCEGLRFRWIEYAPREGLRTLLRGRRCALCDGFCRVRGAGRGLAEGPPLTSPLE